MQDRQNEMLLNETSLEKTFSINNALKRLVRCLFAEGLLDSSKLTFKSNQAFYPLKQGQLLFEHLEHAPADTFIYRGQMAWINNEGHQNLIADHHDLIELVKG